MLHQLFAPNCDDLYQIWVEFKVRVEFKEIRYIRHGTIIDNHDSDYLGMVVQLYV